MPSRVVIAGLALAVVCLGGCDKGKVSIQVASVRAGEFYEADPPQSDPRIHWMSGSAEIGGERMTLVLEGSAAKGWTTDDPRVLVRTEGGLFGRLASRTDKNIFATEVVNFLPFSDKPGQEPKGEFWQVVLSLKDLDAAPATLWLHSKNEDGLNATLLPQGDSEVRPAAFLVPNLNVGKIALLTKWQGKLGVRLAPGNETWLLLLFDVPVATKAAVLTVGETKLEIQPEPRAFSNLVAQRLVRAGSATIRIEKVHEGEKTPFTKRAPKKADNRFVFVDVTVAAIPPRSTIRSLDFSVATQHDEKFGQPGFSTQNSGQNIEGFDGSYANMWAGNSFTLFFEVPKRIALSDLKLVYQGVASTW